MSARRSSRLASKAGKVVGAGEDDLVQSGGPKGRPGSKRASNERPSQKRKRGRSGTTVAENDSSAQGSGNSDTPNTGDTPKVLTQEGPLMAHRRLSMNGSSAFSPISDDVLVLELDKFELHGRMETEPGDVDSQGETVCDEENCSQDMFGDDAEILDMLPLTQDQVTPKRVSKKRSISPKKLACEDNPPLQIAPKPFVVRSNINEFQSAKKVMQLDKDLNAMPEPQPKRGKKRTTDAGGEKKKTAKGKGAKGKKPKNSKFKLAFTNRKAIKELANSASNELSLNDLSLMTTEEKLLLASWSLPPSILNNYAKKKITQLFHWQLECLANEKVLEGRNLLYSAPTSAGKTLVAEILMIKRVLELGRKAIMILPFVSVAREKVYSLQSIFGDAGIRVEGFMGSVNPPGGFKAVDIAVCTIEKANSLINKLLEEDALGDLGTLVVDELHLIGDPHRGYLLELLLTKILYMTSIKNQNPENSMNISGGASGRPKRYRIQIIGMSATLPNLDVLAHWLNAELYVTDFRPVPLKELLKVDDTLYDEKLEPIRPVKTEEIPIKIEGDTDNVVYLALETVLSGFSALIFCPTKVLVEQTAKRIADQFYRIGDPTNNFYPEIGEKLRGRLNGSNIKVVLDQLRQCPGGADEVLSKTICFGIGYHHAGLTYENRDIVESAFKKGILKVIVATSTLSAGVNLPARRVMIITPLFNGSVLDTMTYRQMCGRAGRNGIDTEGESILICPASLKEKGTQLFKGQMPIVRSALLGDGSLTASMKRALLEAIASGIASRTTDVRSYARCTFLFYSIEAGLYNNGELSLSQANKDSTIEKCLHFLESQDFIRIQHFEQEGRPSEYMPTQLGSACLASSLSPDDGIIVYKELLRARECFVLENELHVIYQVTPIYVSDQLRYISWSDYLKIYEDLDESQRKVAGLIGVEESFIIKAMIGTVSWKNPKQIEAMGIHQRFFAALALSDLVNEKSLDYVGKRYNLNKGVLQNLQQTASTFAGMVTAFCNRLGWSNLELLLSQFQERLEFGVQRELCDLVRLDCLNGQRARILYDAGLKSIVELAAADPAQVELVLHKNTPFKSDVHGGRESSIWLIGKESLTEAQAAQKIVQDARDFVQIELGHQGNIKFAFGGNDVPTLSGHKNHVRDSTGIGMKNNVISNKSVDASKMGQQFEFEDGNDKQNVDVGNGSSNSGNKSYIRHSEQSDNEFEAEKCKKDTEDLFLSQKPLETSKSASPVASSNQLDDPIFGDSFPEMDTQISGFYYKPNENARDENAGSKFSIQQEVEKVGIVKPLVNRIQCDSYKPPDILQHSTPLVCDLAKRKRFTLKENEQTSPVRSVSPEPVKKDKSSFIGNASRNALNLNCDEISVGIMAEFNKPFDSFGDGLEYSMEFNNDVVDGANSKSNECESKEKSESVLFNDSYAAAIKAVAEDTNFDSEELFTEGDEQPKESHETGFCDSVRENGRFDGLDDEDFIMTQGSFLSDQMVEKEENEFMEGSASETESSSAWTDNSAFKDINYLSPSEISVHEATVGKLKIVTRRVKSADLIPSSFFSDTNLLGMGMKLVSHKKPSASIARQGIGAKIVGTCSTANATVIPQGENFHSLALYNGLDSIYVLRWENENGLRVGGSLKHSAKNSQLEELLRRIETARCAIAMFESKEKIKCLLRHFGSQILGKLPPGERIWDPRIAQWMWEFDDEDWNVSKRKLIDEYVTEEEKSITNSDFDKETIESFFVWKVMAALKEKLLNNGLWTHFTTTEMPSIIPLLHMEINGLGLDNAQLSNLKKLLQFKSALLELRAFQLAGRQFNLGSPKDIKQILFRDIGLTQPKNNKGTGKDVLLKLGHELAVIIVEWRKVTSALQKVVMPFQQERNLETGRVHGQYSHFTVTGRVVMSDPSLQCIPRDFDIQISYDSKQIVEIKSSCKIKFGSKLAALFQQLDNNAIDNTLHNTSLISMRNAFIPWSEEFVILTADYSQLELRILAHLSGDTKLLEALNKGSDVFTEIASQWKKLPLSEITSSMRQEAKGIVYGVIYGMGARTLAEQMEIDEREATRFIGQFMRTYPGISAFIEKAHRLCQDKGYVETMTGRRRYLPLIYSRNPHEKAKANRQALNSQIQGSAADLVKTAMAKIHSLLQSKYPKSAFPIEWNKIPKGKRSSISFQVSRNTAQLEDLVFFPVLNLHDELIFEVRKSHLEEIAKAVKSQMESCVTLNVKLPVVIKTGDSWGNMVVYEKH